MSDMDKPTGDAGKAPEGPASGEVDAIGKPAGAGGALDETQRRATPRDRYPARGFVLAMAAGLILWALVIYLFSKLL